MLRRYESQRYPRGISVAILASMLVLMRVFAISLSVLVFAVVLAVCGEAVACEACLHACCVRSDRLDRSANLAQKVAKSYAALALAARSAHGTALSAPIASLSWPTASVLLPSQATTLRI